MRIMTDWQKLKKETYRELGVPATEEDRAEAENFLIEEQIKAAELDKQISETAESLEAADQSARETGDWTEWDRLDSLISELRAARKNLIV